MCAGSHFGEMRPFWLFIHKIISRNAVYKYRRNSWNARMSILREGRHEWRPYEPFVHF